MLGDDENTSLSFLFDSFTMGLKMQYVRFMLGTQNGLLSFIAFPFDTLACRGTQSDVRKDSADGCI